MKHDLNSPSEEPVFRDAVPDDLPTLVDLLADDILGARRENPSRPIDPDYGEAFSAIDRDPNAQLLVATIDGQIVGFLQLNLMPGLSHRGMVRAQIESVRVAAHCRGHGIGERLIREAIDRARTAGARMVQLTSNAQRADAQRFYERHGFVASHVGFKLDL